jgi:hypothetical protein
LIVQHAKTQWLRMINGGRQYEEELPENPEKLPTVDWAAMPWAFADILAKAFSPSTHVILNAQHLLVDYLFGRA